MNTTELIIDVRRINKSFDGKKAVNNLTLQVQRGEIYGFLGPNGGGKTTTIRMFCGLLTPDTGQGIVCGYDILTQTALIKRNVGYMTQNFSLYEDLSVYENLDFIARIYQLPDRKKRIAATIQQFGFTDFQKQLAGELSGGWKQRLALAVALLHKPTLLLLDEPTAGVDPSARRAFWDYLHQLSATGVTTLVSTHYMDEAERCHRIAYLADGRILTSGKISEVLAKVPLITWAIKGENLFALTAKLRETPGVEQVVVFGETIHVSSKNAALLQGVIAALQTQGYSCRLVTENLEDVFISLVEDV